MSTYTGPSLRKSAYKLLNIFINIFTKALIVLQSRCKRLQMLIKYSDTCKGVI